MLIDGGALESGAILRTRVCVIGAGAAGITIARELSRRGIGTLLLESGGYSPRPETQALYDGEVEGPLGAGYLMRSRLRYFGGTTNHWGGNCRPLDPIDFEPLPGVRDEGWPITRAVLDPYYERAAAVCEISPFPAAPADAPLPGPSPIPLEPAPGVRTRTFHTSPPTRFGERYRDALERSPHVRVLTDATAMELMTDPEGGRVRRIAVRTGDGRALEVQPEIVVLATGAIENARLLLLSDGVHRTGLGNRHDLVGRYFSEHGVLWNAGTILGWQPSERLRVFGHAHRQRTAGRPDAVWGVLSPDAHAMRRRGLRNAYVALHDPRPALSAAIPAEQRAGELESAVAVTARGLDVPTREQRDRVSSRALLVVCFEPAPDPENRVVLTSRRDRLGQRTLRLRWHPSEADIASARGSLELLAAALGRAGAGRLHISPTLRPDRVTGMSHHMGTTRMHESPRRGVVDADCRLHGVGNLFVAGSSVFPSYGYANPTLTLVALALRIADRIAESDLRPIRVDDEATDA